MIKQFQKIIKHYKSIYLKSSYRTRKAIRNIVGISIVKGGDLIVGLLLVTISLTYLGQTNYGIWLTLSSIVTWFNFFDGGLGLGLRNKFAEALAKNEKILAREYVSTTYFLLSILSIILFIVFFIIYNKLSWASFLNTNEYSNYYLSTVALVVFGGFFIQLTFRLIKNLLLANQQPAIDNLIMFLGKILVFVGILILPLFFKNSLLAYGIVFTVAPVFAFILASICLFYGKYKEYAPSIKFIKLRLVNNLSKLSLSFFVIQISVAVLFTTDNFIIAQLFDPSEVTPYHIANKYFSVGLIIFTIIMTPMWSAYTEAYIKQEMNWIRNTLKKLFATWFFLFLFVLIMLATSNYIYKIWVGENVRINWLVSFGWALFVILQMFNMIFTHFLNGISKIRIQLYTAISSIIINIPLSIYFAKYLNFGVAGVIFATNISILIYIIFRAIQVKKILNGKAKGIWNR